MSGLVSGGSKAPAASAPAAVPAAPAAVPAAQPVGQSPFAQAMTRAVASVETPNVRKTLLGQ